MPKPITLLPETEVKEDRKLQRRSRRTFSRDYKLSIIDQADACEHGEIGELLRREKLYSNQLSQWRQELATGGVEALCKSAPGPAAKLSAEQKRIAALEKENARLRKAIEVKNNCIDLQKKVLTMIEQLERGDMQ